MSETSIAYGSTYFRPMGPPAFTTTSDPTTNTTTTTVSMMLDKNLTRIFGALLERGRKFSVVIDGLSQLEWDSADNVTLVKSGDGQTATWTATKRQSSV